MNVLTFSHSASLVTGLGQLVYNFFLMQKVMAPFSGEAQGGPRGDVKEAAKEVNCYKIQVLK